MVGGGFVNMMWYAIVLLQMKRVVYDEGVLKRLYKLILCTAITLQNSSDRNSDNFYGAGSRGKNMSAFIPF